MTRAWLFAALLALSACAEGDIVDVAPQGYVAAMAPTPPEASQFENRLDRFAPRPGYTYATATREHGVQIEYFAPEGQTFLWYPGNAVAVPGEYRYKLFIGPEVRSIYDIEFRYPSASRNPVTGQSGGRWDFVPGGLYQRQVIAYAKGDPFRLATGRVPFVRPACQLPAPMTAMKAGPVPLC